MKVGYIGLGAMGYPMALNLYRAGILGTVWNRTPERAEQFAAETGVERAASPAQVAQSSNVVFINVSADDDVLEMVEAVAPSVSAGTIVIDCSTVSSATARAAAGKLAAVDAHFLDAPVSGGVEGAQQGTLSIMVGGDPEILEQARAALESVSGRLIYMGPSGAGQATKAVNQIMGAGVAEAVTEALAFGQAMKLDMDRVIEAIGAGAAGNWFLEHRGPAMLRGVFEPGFRVVLHHKDLLICREMAAAAGVVLPIVEAALADYAQLMEQAHGNEDISSLFRLKQAMFKGY